MIIIPSPVMHSLMQAGSVQVGSVQNPRQRPKLLLGIQSPTEVQVSSSPGLLFVAQHILCPLDLQGWYISSEAVPLG